MQAGQIFSQNGVLRRARQNDMEFAIKPHELFAVARRDPLPRPRQDVGHVRDLVAVGTISRKPRAIAFIEQPHFDDLKAFIEADRPHDHALARNDVDHALMHQPPDRLMHRGATDAERERKDRPC